MSCRGMCAGNAVFLASRWCWVADGGAVLLGNGSAGFHGGAVLLGNGIPGFHGGCNGGLKVGLGGRFAALC